MDIDESTKEQARTCASPDRLDQLIRSVKIESARRRAKGETKAEDDTTSASRCQKYKVF